MNANMIEKTAGNNAVTVIAVYKERFLAPPSEAKRSILGNHMTKAIKGRMKNQNSTTKSTPNISLMRAIGKMAGKVK